MTMIKKFLNKEINIENLFLIFAYFNFLFIIVLFFENQKNIKYVENFSENNILDLLFFLDYRLILSFFLLFLVFSLVVFFNNYKNNHFITLINLNFLLFYLLKLSYILIIGPNYLNPLFSEADLKQTIDYKHIVNLSYQYFIICIITFYLFRKINFNSFNLTNKNFITQEKFFYYRKILIFFILLILITNFLDLHNTSSHYIFQILFKIFDIDIFIYFYCILFFFYNKKSKFEIFLFLIVILAYISNGMYFIGSRSTHLQIIINFIFIIIISSNFYKIKISNFLYLPFIIPISIYLFSLSGIFRKYFFVEKARWQGMGFFEYYGNQFAKDDTTIIISKKIYHIFIGFLDRISVLKFYLINMEHKLNISNYININYYFKSIIDRLTPGLDLYNVPLVKNKLYGILIGPGQYSNSIQFTFFAENSIIFGIYSIFYIFFVIFILKFIFQKIILSKNNILKLVYLGFVYQIFWLWITGFGFDYFFVKIVYLIIFLIPISIFFKSYEKKN